MDCINKKTCRLCHNDSLTMIMDLGNSALANEFVSSKDTQDTFPLALQRCNNCGHYQLLDVVKPERMFKNYLYVSGTSKLMRDHFTQYAIDTINNLSLTKDSFVCDIGSNDSTLLKEYKSNSIKVMGIEPAENLAKKSIEDGIPTINNFFSIEIAKHIVKMFGKADLVTSNNCFAHLDDLESFTMGVKELLSDNGTFVFENAYLVDMIKTNDFSQIYHEHLSYHSIKPLNTFFNRLNLYINKVEFINIHGGSIRVYVSKTQSEPPACIKDEEEFGLYDPFINIHYWKLNSFNTKNEEIKLKLKEKINSIKSSGKTIAGVLASAKSTTFLHYFDLDLDFIADDAPEKINKFSPGKHIPIFPFNDIYKRRPDYLLILSYNFAEFIMEKHKNYRGTWIVPFPEVKEVK